MDPNDTMVTSSTDRSESTAEPVSTAIVVTRPLRDIRELRTRLQPSERTMRFVDDAVRVAFDTTDRLADAIAEELGIRRPGDTPATPKPPVTP